MSQRRTYTSHMDLPVIPLSALLCLMVLGATGYIVSTHTQSIQVVLKPISLKAETNVRTRTLS